jgi:dCTP deaminase
MIIPGQKIESLNAIKPFLRRSVENGMTYGVGPAGYDVRISNEIMLYPGCFALGVTIEEFSMPDDVIAFVHDKSTWARRGLSLFNTVIEPGWRGFLTLELINHGYDPLLIPAGCPIAQIVFMRLEEKARMPYRGKYQDQPNVPVESIMEWGDHE